MFTVNISTQKLTDAEKILALGEPEKLVKIDFVLVDAAGQPVNAENCQFDLMMGEVNCPRYKTDANTVSFRYIALDITKAQTEFALTLKKDGAIICNDSIKVTAEVQGGGSSEVQGIVYNNVPSKATTVQIIPETLTADFTDFSSMFDKCYALTTIPALDTSKGTNFNNMFYSCTKITTIEGIDFSGATSSISKDIFNSCSALTSVKVNGVIPVAIDISQAPNLDLTSLNSFCDALQTKTSGVYYLTLTQTQYNQLSSSKINAVKNKGWGFKIA